MCSDPFYPVTKKSFFPVHSHAQWRDIIAHFHTLTWIDTYLGLRYNKHLYLATYWFSFIYPRISTHKYHKNLNLDASHIMKFQNARFMHYYTLKSIGGWRTSDGVPFEQWINFVFHDINKFGIWET